MKKLLSLLILFAAILSFQTTMAQQTEPTAQTIAKATKMLNGSWEWTETTFASRGVKPSTKTPATTKKKITVTFKPDNQVTVFENGKLVGTYAYKLSIPTDYIIISFSDESGRNPVREYLEEGPITVSANELYIAGGYNDAGSNQKFKKLKAVKTSKTTKKKK